jgi:hypothetical protein
MVSKHGDNSSMMAVDYTGYVEERGFVLRMR